MRSSRIDSCYLPPPPSVPEIECSAGLAGLAGLIPDFVTQTIIEILVIDRYASNLSRDRREPIRLSFE